MILASSVGMFFTYKTRLIEIFLFNFLMFKNVHKKK